MEPQKGIEASQERGRTKTAGGIEFSKNGRRRKEKKDGIFNHERMGHY